MTDPSYKGQILVLTYPLIGNYGVPSEIPVYTQRILIATLGFDIVIAQSPDICGRNGRGVRNHIDVLEHPLKAHFKRQ